MTNSYPRQYGRPALLAAFVGGILMALLGLAVFANINWQEGKYTLVRKDHMLLTQQQLNAAVAAALNKAPAPPAPLSQEELKAAVTAALNKAPAPPALLSQEDIKAAVAAALNEHGCFEACSFKEEPQLSWPTSLQGAPAPFSQATASPWQDWRETLCVPAKPPVKPDKSRRSGKPAHRAPPPPQLNWVDSPDNNHCTAVAINGHGCR